jgi:homocysteine S-methyltransferase
VTPSALLVDPFAVIDGGLSTALELRGHRPSGALWTAQFVVDRPDEITAAHRSFVEAGADVIITSSYQASVAGFIQAGLSRAAAVTALTSTTSIARRSGAAVVAASVGPFGATLGDGSEYHGRYEAGWSHIRRFHRERLAQLCDSGPDLLAIETIPGRAEADIVLDELHRISSVPAWLSVSCVDASHTCAGDDIADVAALAAASPNIIAMGVNCTDPTYVADLLRRCGAVTPLPLVAYPNHGRTWDAAHKCWVGAGDGRVAERVADWYDIGARLIGGCCGVGPDGIAEVVVARAALACRP